ncbi:hypothetical protein [Sphingobium cloacae]|uniref:hypothetical protein n=1 Tax=Sphingobium cloacae TaxID=120107 RepID=UPI000831E1C9|nr:hypothetical protein [Sphingobium cloacae]
MNARFIDWIWHIRGSVTLAPGQSGDEVFDRLDPLFREAGTSHERDRDMLTFRKKDQAAQDKMSVFDGGVLRIEEGAEGPVLRYHLVSRALLFCFLAPLLFLSFAGLAIGISMLDKPSVEAVAAKKEKEEKKEKATLPQNPIDTFLGAPAPEKPKKDSEKKSGEEEGKHSPTPAYVFAGLFAILYGVGRILEDRLVRSLFRKKLLGQ